MGEIFTWGKCHLGIMSYREGFTLGMCLMGNV